MREHGLWQRISACLVDVAARPLALDCDRVFKEIGPVSAPGIAAAILGGEGFETIWERTRR
jgi:hypothetical protein